MNLPAYFANAGTPKTGLAPTITVYNITDGTEDVTAAAMTEVGGGWYNYDHSVGDESDHLVYTVDSVTLSGNERYAAGEWVPNPFSLIVEIAKLTGHDVKKSGNVITIYESKDGSATTVWRQYNLTGGGRLVV